MEATKLLIILYAQSAWSAIPNCNNNGPSLISGQNFCLFNNYSKYEAPIKYYGQDQIRISADFEIISVDVDQSAVLWGARMIAILQWNDHRILMNPSVRFSILIFC
jgi:hypothetical protein